MEFTCELSKAYTINPFEIMEQDKDNVIMLINYYVVKGQDTKQPPAADINNFNEKQSDKKSFWALV